MHQQWYCATQWPRAQEEDVSVVCSLFAENNFAPAGAFSMWLTPLSCRLAACVFRHPGLGSCRFHGVQDRQHIIVCKRRPGPRGILTHSIGAAPWHWALRPFANFGLDGQPSHARSLPHQHMTTLRAGQPMLWHAVLCEAGYTLPCVFAEAGWGKYLRDAAG